MSTIAWTKITLPSPAAARPLMAGAVRKLAWWSGAAAGAIVTNSVLLLGLLYWFSVLE